MNQVDTHKPTVNQLLAKALGREEITQKEIDPKLLTGLLFIIHGKQEDIIKIPVLENGEVDNVTMVDLWVKTKDDDKRRVIRTFLEEINKRSCFSYEVTDKTFNDLEGSYREVGMASSIAEDVLKMTFDETFSESAARRAKELFIKQFYIPLLETDRFNAFLQGYERPKLDVVGHPLVLKTYELVWRTVFERIGFDNPSYDITLFDDMDIDLRDLRELLTPKKYGDLIQQVLLLYHGRNLSSDNM